MARRTGKRSRKYRGSRTHGWGAGKKHRGKGNVGGKGFAWCKHMWIYTLKYEPDHFGKHGFHSLELEIPSVINAGELDEMAETLVERGIARKEGDKIFIDASRLRVEKILGGGRVTRPLVINADGCSGPAKRKIEGAGGQVIVPTAAKKPPKTGPSPAAKPITTITTAMK